MIETLEKILVGADQIDAQNAILLSIANKMGAVEPPKTWSEFQTFVRAGSIGMYVNAGDQVTVGMNPVLTVSCEGEGVVSATVNSNVFYAAAGSGKTDYVFLFDGTHWNYAGDAVVLSDYGIAVTSGTPADGDTITVHNAAVERDFDVLGLNEDEPADPSRKNVVSIQMHRILDRVEFDPAQYLFAVTDASLAEIGIEGSVLPAGTYNITLDHGAFSGGTEEDGTYQFTTTVNIPAGGGIRHSYIGTYQEDSADYSKDNVIAGTFITYGADTVTVLESDIATVEGTDGVDLGTTTASDPTYIDGNFINFTQRQMYGGNRWSTSYLRQYLNSDEATFAWTPKTVWSRNVENGATEGFLYTLVPDFRAVIGRVRKRYALSAADGGGYEDAVDYVTLNTMLDIGGGPNNSVTEGPVNSRGVVSRTGAYSLWEAASDADRVKYIDTAIPPTAINWWLSSAQTTYAHNERIVSASGTGSVANGGDASGVVPCMHII